MKIYLAGGMRPRKRVDSEGNWTDFNWQDVVKDVLAAKHEVFDPRDHNTKVFTEYSFLDLMRLRQCDLVIAYIEAENPSPMGLAGEVGFAKGLGKTVLLVNEKHEDRYTKFTENFADTVFQSFEAALEVIAKV